MKKLATLTVAAAIIAMSGTAVYAQSNDAPGKGAQQERVMKQKGDWQARRTDMHRLMEARIAGIPAGLKLTADQQKLWAPVEAAMKANMKARSDLMDKMRETRKDAKERPDFLARLEYRNQMAQMAAQNSKSMLDAMTPFWASLDDGQKKLLPALMTPRAATRGKGRMNGGRWGAAGAGMRGYGCMSPGCANGMGGMGGMGMGMGGN